MGLDIAKIKKEQEKIDQRIKEEIYQDLSENLLNFLLDKDLKENFHEEKSRKRTEQSKRVISYWVKKGVIKAEQNTEGGWFYFDRIESIWIDIVSELRDFGLDLDKIVRVREELFDESIQNFKLIEFALIHSILKEPYLMIIYKDGTTSVTTTSVYSETIKSSNLPPHIVFNFFYLANQIFPNNNFELLGNLGLDNELKASEMKVLYFIRTGDFQEIKIRMKDGDIYLVEGNRQLGNKEKIIDIINNASYQNIEIRTEKGKIVNINSSEKFKI
ncbi:MerR family transcriptional regulator [Flavobacterium sp.]|uniref:MerR family transcriptional regulator n=1 Tax=Flavobacterium sp. TaxID=239 RepID=UPI003D6A6230